jgi:hypothetical protein
LDLVEPADPVLKHGLEELASPVGGLPKFSHQFCKLLTGKAKKIFDTGRGWAV